jgi:hypothetical protein
MPKIRIPESSISDEDATRVRDRNLCSLDLSSDPIFHATPLETYGKYAASVYQQCQTISDYVKDNMLGDISDLFTRLGYTFHQEDREGLFRISKFLMWSLLFDRDQLRKITARQYSDIKHNFGQCIGVAKDRRCLSPFIKEIEIRGLSKAINEIVDGVCRLYESPDYDRHVYEIEDLRRDCILLDELHLVSYKSADKSIRLCNISSFLKYEADILKFKVFNYVAEFIAEAITETPLHKMKELIRQKSVFGIVNELANLSKKGDDVLKRISEMEGTYTLHYMIQLLIDNIEYNDVEYEVISKLAKDNKSRYVWNAEFDAKYSLYGTKCLLHFHPDSKEPDGYRFTEDISRLMNSWDGKLFYEGLIRLFSYDNHTMQVPIQVRKDMIMYWDNPVMTIGRTGFIRSLTQDSLCDSDFSVNIGISLLY